MTHDKSNYRDPLYAEVGVIGCIGFLIGGAVAMIAALVMQIFLSFIVR